MKGLKNRTRVGIFQGKRARYNRSVLIALLKRGPSTSWELAKAIQKQHYPIVESEAGIYQSQKIYSVLARKGGVLDRLREKKYIGQQNSKWELIFLKSLVALIDSPEMINNIHPSYTEETKIKMRKHLDSSVKGSSPKTVKGPFGLRIYIDPMQIKLGVNRFLDNISMKEAMLLMAKKMSELHQEGIALDEIEPQELNFLVLNRMKDWIISKMQTTIL